MTSRRPLIAANWKMNPLPDNWAGAASPYRPVPGVDVIVFPSFLHLAQCKAVGLMVGGQFGRAEETGAFTGDISMKMLRDEGCMAVLCGHSERRTYHHETDAEVAAQVKSAIAAGLHPIVCIGETKEEREKGQMEEVLKRQLSGIDGSVSYAYEPVWAIGTGVAAEPADIAEAHAFIRSLLPEDQQSPRILYGGSANAENARSILTQPHVDGLLVGSASLKHEEFARIVASAATLVS